jgi:hypothetical protein
MNRGRSPKYPFKYSGWFEIRSISTTVKKKLHNKSHSFITFQFSPTHKSLEAQGLYIFMMVYDLTKEA